MKRLCIYFILIISSIAKAYPQTKQYFPLAKSEDEAKTGDSKLDSFDVKWYSEQLGAMNEPVLYNDKSPSIVYRFTWLRSFHHPVAIRIEKQGTNYMLYWKECDGAGGYEPGNLFVDKKKKINQAVWREFENKIVQMHFDTMKTNIDVFGNDGASWVLEGKWDKKYHLVNRWTVGGTKDFYMCCVFLLHLTDIDTQGKVY